jgi:transglutaminase-like putative cysteine protease
MKIACGYTISYRCAQDTPMLLMLRVHPSRQADLEEPERITFDPPLRAADYLDGFGNVCTRITAPAGLLTISSRFTVRDSGEPDLLITQAEQHPLEDLPDHVLVFLLGSRYCDTDRLSDEAWALFGNTPPGWRRVQAICDYVHDRIAFGYADASSTRTAWDAHRERRGVCRDFAHLAIAFCRCMNIPARYCTGYLGDIGVPPDPAPMDFSAWFEVFLSGQWYRFDARHNVPRIGRILMARGRDATDVALSTNFGPSILEAFEVITAEVLEPR